MKRRIEHYENTADTDPRRFEELTRASMLKEVPAELLQTIIDSENQEECSQALTPRAIL
jgi:hypothetical protein